MVSAKLEKIVLAVPEVKTGRSFVGAALPPLGPTRIATLLKQKYPYIEVEVWDGVLLGQAELCQRAKQLPINSILGVSAHTTLNWSNCLDLIKISPANYTLIGGIHAMGKRCGRFIVQNHGLDVIQGAGEIPFVEYVEYVLGRRPKESVQNLIYLDKTINCIRENEIKLYNQTEFPFADYETFLPLSQYAKHFHDSFLTGDIGFTMISPEGCKWQELSKRKNAYCLYCDIGTDFVLHDPEFFGRWINDHVQRYGKYGKIFMIDYADEATGAGIGWWKSVLQKLPKQLKPHENYGIKVYAKSGKGFFDSDEMAKILWQIGVEDIHVGFEAAIDEDLRSLHKGTNLKYHSQAINIAKRHGFRIFASFVLGAPTASKSSIGECVYFVEKMKDILGDKVAVVTGSPLMPLPGAPVWQMLRKEALARNEYTELFDTDTPDIYLARKLWYKWFCPTLTYECGGEDGALAYVKQIGTTLNKMGSLPTPENEFG